MILPGRANGVWKCGNTFEYDQAPSTCPGASAFASGDRRSREYVGGETMVAEPRRKLAFSVEAYYPRVLNCSVSERRIPWP